MRVKAVIAYDGSFFQGFQRQTRTRQTVTGSLESALRSLHIDSDIVGSGRTDAGVHASGQVIHFDLPGYWKDVKKLQHELNRKLRHIRIKRISMVEKSFHARFSAKKRIYRYIFKRQMPSLFEENYVAHYPDFDPLLLCEALKTFEGEQDFCHFYKTGSDIHSTVREVFRTRYRAFGNYHILYFEANGFLRGQVRMMVAAAMQCASGHLQLDMLREQVSGRYRHSSSLAPSSGLYLARIIY